MPTRGRGRVIVIKGACGCGGPEMKVTIDDNVFDSELYDDEDGIVATHGHGVGVLMGGLIADDDEENSNSTTTRHVYSYLC